MPPRNNPTARQARLGAELRKMRERAGLTAREAAARLGVTPMRMSHIEIGRLGVGEERLRKLAAQYECADQALIDALVGMTGRQGRGWWEKFRGSASLVSLDLAELEWHARSLRSLQVVHIPGLLQSEGHVRALYNNTLPELSAGQIDAMVEFRTRRRRVFDRDDPPKLDAVIHEAALRIRVGDRKLAHEQLHLLLELSERPEVTVRVIPFERDGFTEASFPMLYAEGQVRQLDTAQFDTVHGSVFVHDEKDLVGYRAVLDAVKRASLPSAESRDFILRIARDL
ncbi:helix-turn-helix domain-containing protein [Streptomyces abikoensis]|uniref:helix-turn-helix domain-containing protein n=1 Tax=Streptomyces abikoensis TaxID=97398 RepID=UPI0016777E44|nr:helix-turn-helix transcriptional regulator [Streptomyces abikoensis]GGP71337.1 transcriptional regulator [Streptomyces abikoensis]